MMYSCALWGPEEGGVRGDVDFQPSTSTSPASSTGTLVCEPTWQANALESAQARKIDHVLAALRLRPGMRLLEFGSGWGALAIRAAQKYGVEVDTLTLSVEQKRLAEERIHAAGLVGRVRVHLMDYRETPSSWDGLFDAFVSVEMLEVCLRFFSHP
jgi:cyclopropane-fatty-acyl-phospholipid synthase